MADTDADLIAHTRRHALDCICADRLLELCDRVELLVGERDSLAARLAETERRLAEYVHDYDELVDEQDATEARLTTATEALERAVNAIHCPVAPHNGVPCLTCDEKWDIARALAAVTAAEHQHSWLAQPGFGDVCGICGVAAVTAEQETT